MQTFLRLLSFLLVLEHTALSQVPQFISCEGRVAAGGAAIDGPGQFKFALVDAAGTVSYWSNDGTSAAGSEPAMAVVLTVSGGSYSVLLGDASLPNMTAVPEKVLTTAGLHLRVWFDDGTNGSQLLSPDAPIAPSAPAAAGNGRIPRGSGGAPGTDCWKQRGSAGTPAGRTGHTTVWTGSEMIVWGGTDGSTALSDGGRFDPAGNSWSSLPTSGAPAARSGHAAVWTGSEMIVWGGYAGATLFNDGARFNPVTNSWTAMTTANAPSARAAHTAVWTGSEMIVWGGEASTGGRYSPATDSWTPVTITGAPAARYLHSAVWTGSEMIVWGGYDNTSYLNDGARYSPAMNTWTAVSTAGSAPAARGYQTAVWTGSEMVVWGGFNDGGFRNDGGRYNPAGNSWTAMNTGDAPGARYYHSAVWTGSEMIVWGGFNYDGSSRYLNDGARYHPAANTWSAMRTAGAPAGRNLHTAVWTGSGMIVWGGSYTDQTASYPNGVGRYRSDSNTWAADAPEPSARLWHKAVWTGSEMIVWGGADMELGTRLNTGARYNPATNAWQPTSTVGAPAARTYHSAVWTGSGMIVWGGGGPGNRYRDGGRYNPVLDTWVATRLPGAPAGRDEHSAVWTGSHMIVWGGVADFGANYLNDGALYDPAQDQWQAMTLSDAPTARVAHTAVWTGTRMLVWGGFTRTRINEFPYLFDDERTYNTGGSYDPVQDSWSGMNGFGAPGSRKEHTAVWTGTEMIVWGGVSITTNLLTDIISRTALNDGARYNPATGLWTPLAAAQAPSRRGYHTAVWTGKEMAVWGGLDGIQFGTAVWRGDGGRYSPATNTWSAMSPAGAPRARFSHASVWTGSEMLLFGGLGEGSMEFNDIWSWDPGNITPPVPSKITGIVRSDGQLTLQFTTEPGSSYTLWRSDTLAAGSWTNTGLSPLAGTGTPLEFTVSAPVPPARRFFRVQSQPQ